MNPWLHVPQVFFHVFMGALMPARKCGVFGSPDEPLYIEAGEQIPWWIECRWPLHMDLTFGCDMETYYEDGHQVVRALADYSGAAMQANAKGWDGLIVGAPTMIINIPRKRPRARVKSLALAEVRP